MQDRTHSEHLQRGVEMAHQVPWNKVIVETFVEEAMLTKEEEMILRTRVAGWTRNKQASEFGMSVSTVDRIIARLKAKYDNVQRYNVLLPPRRHSDEEVWLDTH